VDEDAHTAGLDGLRALGTRYAGVPGLDFVAPDHMLDGVAATLDGNGVPRMDAELLELLRIEAGSPRWGAELDEGRIPIEAGLTERAISQTKGCYTGQEVIIRILHRGHVNWHLSGFEAVDGGGGMAAGDEMTAPDSEKVVARITSAAASPRLGRIALGYARRELEPGALLAGPRGGRARLTTLPFPSR
jgi:folate-binding protein YgfZ